MLRVAGSLTLGEVRGHDLIRMLSRDGRPTGLGDAFAHYGRIFKTLHLLQFVSDEGYRRHDRRPAQRPTRAATAWPAAIFFGNRGELRQRYREGMEDQLGALGLALNAVVLFEQPLHRRRRQAAPRPTASPSPTTSCARLSPAPATTTSTSSAATPSPPRRHPACGSFGRPVRRRKRRASSGVAGRTVEVWPGSAVRTAVRPPVSPIAGTVSRPHASGEAGREGGSTVAEIRLSDEVQAVLEPQIAASANATGLTAAKCILCDGLPSPLPGPPNSASSSTRS